MISFFLFVLVVLSPLKSCIYLLNLGDITMKVVEVEDE